MKFDVIRSAMPGFEQFRCTRWARRLLQALPLAALFAAYFVASRLGLAMLAPELPIATIWPAAGIFVGGLAIVPGRSRLVLAAGVFAIAWITSALGECSLETSVALAFATTLEGGIFFALYRFRGWAFQLGSPLDFARFLAASSIACAVSALVAILAFRATDAPIQAGTHSWMVWFMADLVGIVVAAPPLLAITKGSRHKRLNMEALLVVAGGTAMSLLVLLTPRETEPDRLLPVTLIFPFLFWAGARCSTLANAILSAMVCTILIYSIGHGLGPFSSLGWSMSRSIFAVQNFALSVTSGSLLLSILFTERRDKEAQLADALEAHKTLLYEVNHRVKNSLQLVSSILTIEATQLRDPKARSALKTARARIDIIAGLHRRLYTGGSHAQVDIGAVLRETAEGVIRAAGRKDVALRADIEADMFVDVSLATPLSLALAEIVTNSVKHAYRDEGGAIDLYLASADSNLILKIRDSGPGLAPEQCHSADGSVGMRLINNLLKQVDAVVEWGPEEKGVSYVITIAPRAWRAAPGQ